MYNCIRCQSFINRNIQQIFIICCVWYNAQYIFFSIRRTFNISRKPYNLEFVYQNYSVLFSNYFIRLSRSRSYKYQWLLFSFDFFFQYFIRFNINTCLKNENLIALKLRSTKCEITLIFFLLCSFPQRAALRRAWLTRRAWCGITNWRRTCTFTANTPRNIICKSPLNRYLLNFKYTMI